MTFARTVRLLATFVIVAGIFASTRSLFAQSAGLARQYDPMVDGAEALPATLEEPGWGDIPAYVFAVSGDARLDRDGQNTADFEQVPLQVGDQIRTTRGRVEILYDDGSVVALDEYSAVSIDAESTWRLHTGRMKLVSRTGAFAVDASPAGVAKLRSGGEYRVTLSVNRRNEPEVELAVTRGSGELENELGRTLVRAGTRALTTAAFAPSVPYAYVAPRDEFERWTESLEASRYGVTSARYLPVELRAYGGDFDRYGSWSHHHTHGWVWYPRVAVGWEPFRSGRWSFVVGFGYNWIGGSRWEWPTYYYGRWDRYGSNWFWVPSRPHYRRVGYHAPRTSAFVHVNFYTRPQPTRPLPSYRGSSNQRSKIVEVPRGDNRRPTIDRPASSQDRVAIPRGSAVNRDTFPTRSLTPQETRPTTPSDNRVFERRQAAPSPQDRVAIPRSSAGARETFPTRSSGAQTARPSDDRVFGSRSPRTAPEEGVRQAPPNREPSASRPNIFSRRPSPAQPSSPQPSVEAPRPSRTEARPPSAGGGAGRMPDPGRVAPSQPAGSRTPSSSSRPTGTAVRRGGGGSN